MNGNVTKKSTEKIKYQNNKTINQKEQFTHEKNENIIYGRNAVLELLKSGRSIDKIYIKIGERTGSLKLIESKAIENGIPLVEAGNEKLSMLCDNDSHQGVAAIALDIEFSNIEDILKTAEERNEKPFIVIIDGVEDPYNLGAVIRSAECSGAHGVIIPKRRSSGLGGIVSKASAGAIQHIKIARVSNLAMTIDELKKRGVWIFSTDMEGQKYNKCEITCAAAVIVGGEGNGVSELLKKKSDYLISIPMKGKINSLNVSAAAAVILFEIVRQRDNL